MIPTDKKMGALIANIEQVIKGKPDVVRQTLVALLARGHLLIEDVPGVGKTTLAHALAQSLALTFRRIQFTSDLLPSDVLGTTIYNQHTQSFEFKPGPIFSQIILADEINRTTPKTQSSLLEVMNETQATIDNNTYPLPTPFMVIATQNPVEHHGTYPLPESQLDRFLLRIRIGYPKPADEKAILKTSGRFAEGLKPVLTGEDILALQQQVDAVRVDESLLDYLLAMTEATRTSGLFRLAISPRGTLALYKAAKAYAFIEGRTYCVPDDFKRLAPLAFGHRVVLHPSSNAFHLRNEGSEQVIQELIDQVPVPL